MKLFNYSDQFAVHRVWVEIVDETAKSYTVKLLQRDPTGRQAGTILKPRKRNVVNITEWRKPFTNN
jgi:hypothetical protein